MRGKHIREGGVSPRDWLHFISSLLCHDIGYVRGVCSRDSNGRYVCNEHGDLVELADGATDASMTPYHVSRSKVFVGERFGRARLVQFDTLVIERNIEHTRFPVPQGETHADTADYPGLIRAADLIGQLADVNMGVLGGLAEYRNNTTAKRWRPLRWIKIAERLFHLHRDTSIGA